MKIIRIIARLNVGGPAQHVVWLNAGLRARGHHETLITGSVPRGEADMQDFALSHGVSTLVLPEMSRELSPADVGVIWKLVRLLRREGPDVVHTHTAKAGAVGRTATLLYRFLLLLGLARGRRPRVVHTFHGHVFHGYYGRARTFVFVMIERLLAYWATDRIIVLSQQQQQEINERFRVGRPSQFSIVPLGIDLARFRNWQSTRSAARTALRLEPDEVAIGIVGRLTEIKNHVLFLDTAAELCRRCPGPYRFLVVGDGHLRAPLEAAAADRGLARCVEFLGNRADMDSVYPALDLVVLTSRNEGTPLTLIEGMANARAFVSTAVGGVPDIAGAATQEGDAPDCVDVREHGILVHHQGAAGLATAVGYLVARPELRSAMGRRGEAFVASRHSVDRLVTDIEGLYLASQ